MRNVRASLLLAGALFVLADPVAGQEPRRRPREGTLRVGDPAPDFTLQDIEGKKSATLSRARDRPTVLIFGSCT